MPDTDSSLSKKKEDLLATNHESVEQCILDVRMLPQRNKVRF